MQITDLHYGETLEKDINTTKLVKSLLQEAKPDIIGITGDSLSGFMWDGKNNTFYTDHWNLWTSPFKELEIPYSYTVGNHDAQADFTIEEIIELDKTHEFAVFRENYHKDITLWKKG